MDNPSLVTRINWMVHFNIVLYKNYLGYITLTLCNTIFGLIIIGIMLRHINNNDKDNELKL